MGGGSRLLGPSIPRENQSGEKEFSGNYLIFGDTVIKS